MENLSTSPPPPLAVVPGDCVAVVAPASGFEPARLEEGLALLKSWDLRVLRVPDLSRPARYLSAPDEDRARELLWALNHPQVKAIFAARGGYGCARLIPFLERQFHPQPAGPSPLLVGYSDITLLHLYLDRQGFRGIHGPMMAESAIGGLEARDREALRLLLTGSEPLPPVTDAQLWAIAEGDAQGTLVGGCLSLVVTSLGTAYEINTRGRILFLEEVGEAPYRVDRMLTHLRAAGKLDQAAGILLGDFMDCRHPQEDYDWKTVALDILGKAGCPVLAGFPAGHAQRKFPLPLGTQIKLEARGASGASRVVFLEGLVGEPESHPARG